MTHTYTHTTDDVRTAAQAAHAAFLEYGSSSSTTRSQLLRGLADALEAERDELVTIADEETHLGKPRLNGELDRTSFQLRAFATLVETGAVFAFIDDPAVAGAPPTGRPHLIRTRVPLGPVAVFSASNFPFAFSVLGGDTASALAAGCPVIVKAHHGHRRLSHAVARLATELVSAQRLPAGLFALLDGPGKEVGVALVQDPRICAAAFTGSVRGGLALQQAALSRPVPIPFYGELGSINPVVVLPAALRDSGASLAAALVGSITLGCGQFCTSPGLILVPQGVEGDAFVQHLAAGLSGASTHAMLTPEIRANYDSACSMRANHQGLRTLLAPSDTQTHLPSPFLAETDVQTFLTAKELHDEVFGPAALVVRTRDLSDAQSVLRVVGGSLTVTLWGAEVLSNDVLALVRSATQVAGRVLFAGVPTGVAVTAAQQHGGPFPSSTRPETTSVGLAAVDRFLRPVALQDPPAWLIERKGQPC